MDDAEASAAPATVRSSKRAQPFDVRLGARIRAARAAAGMNQTTLAAAVDVSYQQMQKYETGKDRVSAGTLFRLAAALDVPVGSFFEGEPQNGSDKPPRSGAGDAFSAKIVVLFQKIDDAAIRKQLVALATALADGQTHGASERADGNDA